MHWHWIYQSITLYELNVNQFTLVQFNSGHLTTSQFSTGLSNAIHNYRPANFWKSKCLMVRLDTTTRRNLHRPAAFLCPVEKILLSMIQFGMEEQNDFSPKPRADSRLAPSEWETSLQSNAISHWLGANLESALQAHIMSKKSTEWVPRCLWYVLQYPSVRLSSVGQRSW